MKKLLTLLLTIVMAVCLININSGHVNAEPDYLKITALENADVSFAKNNSCKPNIVYSTDGGSSWSDYDFESPATISLTTGQSVIFKAGKTTDSTITTNSFFSKTSTNYNYFIFTGKVAASGNVMSLVDSSCTSNTIPNTFCFVYLFKDCDKLTSAPSLPATTLKNNCYRYMFSGCTSLTQAPELPANVLVEECYFGMFLRSGLTQAPALPATNLAKKCYGTMFQECKSLTQAPALPATTLADNCYESMFQECTSLTQAPALPATTLAESCYSYMFLRSGLTQAPALPATTLKNNCYEYMFQECKSLTQAPALPATNLANKCYFAMFSGCESLTQAPELPATTLAESCYSYMFEDCSTLSLAPDLKAGTLSDGCYAGMFYNCAALTVVQSTAEKASIIIPTYTGGEVEDMFNGTSKTGTISDTPTAGYYEVGLKKLRANNFTFAAPSNLVYDGSPKTATVTPKTDVQSVVESLTLKYYNGTEKLDSAPVDIGTYTVKVDVTCPGTSGYANRSDITDNTWTFTISSKKPTPTPSPSKKDKSCEKVIGPTWHWNNDKGICEDYGVVGTSTR